ncbi:MAG TPA: hypothetical protein VFX16_21560 [Pseudonocardiaceae bacterium]|nr:hypothetical protein [Pseudonocardiaceae bacterium]
MRQHPWRTIRTLAVATVTLATLTAGAVVVPTLADATTAPTTGPGLSDIRVGRHATYDRIVLDFHGPVPRQFTAAWVPVLTQDPSGKRVALRGNKFLNVVVHGTSRFDVTGRLVFHGPTRFNTPQLTNVRAVAITGDFERVLSVGVGARHRSWVHLFTLTRPSRLVIDIGR